jgi:hypothetical protein
MSELVTMLSHDSGVAGIVIGIAIGLRAVALILCALIEQTAQTRRFTKALEGSEPSERPTIIRSMNGRAAKRNRDK